MGWLRTTLRHAPTNFTTCLVMPQTNRNAQAHAGFTLVELMVTLGIVGILLAISVPHLFVLQIEESLNLAANTVQLAVNQASIQATHPSQLTAADRSSLNGGVPPD